MLDATAHPIATEAPLIGRQPWPATSLAQVGHHHPLWRWYCRHSRTHGNHVTSMALTGDLCSHYRWFDSATSTRRRNGVAGCHRGGSDRCTASGAGAFGLCRSDRLASAGCVHDFARFDQNGLGRRIAFLFIRAIGKHSLGLGYALVITDIVLAAVIPSNGARSGGIIFPIAKSVSEAYESRPGPTAARLGTFLMTMLYQCEVIICAMFLTGQASNAIIAKFAEQATGIELTYTRWFVGAIVPGLVSLLVIPFALYRFFPPAIKKTPAATEMAQKELKLMGRMSSHEIIMLLVFLLVAGLWMTLKLHSIHFAVVPLIGIGVLLLTGVLDWADVVAEREGLGRVHLVWRAYMHGRGSGRDWHHQEICRNYRRPCCRLEVGSRLRHAGARLLLCSLCLRQHNGSRHIDVHAFSDCHYSCGRPTYSGCSFAGLHLKP